MSFGSANKSLMYISCTVWREVQSNQKGQGKLSADREGEEAFV